MPVKKKISVADAQKTKSGKIDKRTKEGKAICERLAKARRAAARKRRLTKKKEHHGTYINPQTYQDR